MRSEDLVTVEYKEVKDYLAYVLSEDQFLAGELITELNDTLAYHKVEWDFNFGDEIIENVRIVGKELTAL